MDLTQGSNELKNARAKKMMLWFGMISIAMMFAGLTSAYVVSKSRPDWVSEIEIPVAFVISTVAIVISSITFYLSKKAIEKSDRKAATLLLLTTFVLGLLFVFFQFQGFSQIVDAGYYFTGSESTITTSFLYAIVFSHLVHVFAGLLVLVVVIYNHFKEKYKPGQTLGLELGAMFWHFLDFLWVYLILFFYFFR
ncbi:cytochrome c oxidase subunit 3 [Galbibacter pacificus]|uniref:Cytochrome c oxidase subunit 3 n=1 Tax=Galbibacter pacificus TaxID=2996052 RepID=A0ABT6FSR7_9FLAO|nr:cytochrome c oxidase subunit 3 [Galbibacter pacificus]MDG3582575.1 cytochrome c oxidase subunit 3 [Galbibacter pacificus]MDG3586306.1 cytochrome c oxidase subunit 3 [Galbibacter pacificus]